MKKASSPVLSYLNKLELKRLGPKKEAGLWICSLPIPRNAKTTLSISGQTGVALPLGQWPDVSTVSPRRVLMVADGGNAAPDTARVTSSASRPTTSPPAASMTLIEKSAQPLFMWERHALRLDWKGRTIEIAMGLTTRGEVHWWEACRLVTVQDLPGCRIIEMGGAIPVEYNDEKMMVQMPGYKSTFLHRHNWLNGHIHARLHANGICEVFAHHINSRFFDDGLPFDDVVPVIGFRVSAEKRDGNDGLPASWDGSCSRLAIGDAQLDMTDVAVLATKEQPGSIKKVGDFVVLQPYAAAQLFGGLCPEDITGNPWILRPEEKKWLRGMARTLRFTVSLNPKRSPAVVRYQAPAWWYGACEEFMPAALLPVSNEFDAPLSATAEWFRTAMVRGGFEDGALPRHWIDKKEWKGRNEPGWEGELPYAHLLLSWRSGDAAMHSDAMRGAYFYTDVAVDHAAKTVRMHGYAPNAISIPMARVHGPVGAWLECGDPYLLNTARAVIETAYWIHKNSWPRHAIGRDACFIRGAMILYRFLGETGYLRIARDSITDVIASQRPNGSFGDQGGGTGIHQWGGYISKPWMGLMALGGVIDYLEMFPDDEEATGCVKRFADWLMKERYDHDGVMGWSYQHDYNGLRQHFNARTGKGSDLLGNKLWHVDYLARMLPFCSLRYGKPAYMAAWEESFRATTLKENARQTGDHSAAQNVQYIPWIQARLWNATLTANGIDLQPVRPGDKSGKATIMTPKGPVAVAWDKNGKCTATGPMKVRIKPLVLKTRL